MEITFWGVRGSLPTPGSHTVRYGGNTPCVEVRPDPETLLILDAGTGLFNLGEKLMKTGAPVRAHILLSHTHWDHIQGLPFFRPAIEAGNEITIIGSDHNDITLESVLADQMRIMYFPLQFSELKSKIDFRIVGEGSFTIGGTKVDTIYVNHPGFTLGYRITRNGKSIVYISDNEPFNREHAGSGSNKVGKPVVELFKRTNGNPNERIVEFARDADMLIHDSMFTPDEYELKEFWGHSDYRFAMGIAVEAKVKTIMLFHHAPNHSDEDVDRIVRDCRKELEKASYPPKCIAAAEGMTVDL
jgi:phosphoribosyl 1,2-cyclic phosphodiesterase